MTDQPMLKTAANVPESQNIFARIAVSVLATSMTTYVLNQFSLHGWNFAALGVDSEIIKSSIEGTVAGVVAAPRNLILSLGNGLIFVRWSCVYLYRIVRYGKEDNQGEP